MKKKLCIIIDSGMVLLLPMLMAYSLVGEATHEYLGIGMFLLFIAHHILNIAWWKHLFQGRYTPLRIVGTTVNFVLAIIMLASYWGLVLMSFHAGMHGPVMMGMIRKNIKMQHPSKIRIWILRMLTLLLVICGIYAFHKNKISSYLFLRTRFVFIDFSHPVVWTLIEYLCVSILFMIIGYVFLQMCAGHTSKNIFKIY